MGSRELAAIADTACAIVTAEEEDLGVSFSISFNRIAERHLGDLRRYDRNLVLDGIKSQLTHQPSIETRNRKQLRDNPLADWELRVDPFRIFYGVDDDARTVRVVAIGRKVRARLLIGGKEFQL